MNPEPNISWIARDAASVRVLEIAGKLADAATTVLITGESGTGKDQLARWIHERGARHDAPLLKIDCASLPAELVESELFGHEKGAFTGAVARKPGRLELARSGTIVLDEVAALTKAVETGRFREDLYFRLNVLAIVVPPLRERRSDIPLLAEYFVERLGPVHGHVDASLDPSASRLLESYDWPGNVRELKNAIEHALIFTKQVILRPENFPEIVRASGGRDASGAGLRSLEDIEREAIKATLDATHYKIGRAAEILGISRKTLLEKRKKYGYIE
jgi:DNA-binding NtrC family response regulator